MKPSWIRSLVIALLCALALAPAGLHAHVCLVALGALESSDCCNPSSCCDEPRSDEPNLRGAADGCECCLEFDLEGNESSLVASSSATGQLLAALPPPLEDPHAAPAAETRARGPDGPTRVPVPRAPGALLPLRI